MDKSSAFFLQYIWIYLKPAVCMLFSTQHLGIRYFNKLAHSEIMEELASILACTHRGDHECIMQRVRGLAVQRAILD